MSWILRTDDGTMVAKFTDAYAKQLILDITGEFKDVKYTDGSTKRTYYFSEDVKLAFYRMDIFLWKGWKLVQDVS